jgi:hypothetical protein
MNGMGEGPSMWVYPVEEERSKNGRAVESLKGMDESVARIMADERCGKERLTEEESG